MATLEKMLISMPLEAAKELNKTGKFTQNTFPPFIPKLFLDQIQKSLKNKTGLSAGVVMCVSRIGGRKVSIDILNSEEGYSLQDLISIIVGDVVMEFAFPSDQVLSIDAERLWELCSEASLYGEVDSMLLEDLDDSLVIGVSRLDKDALDVYSFLPELTVKQFQRGYILDSKWGTENFRTSSDNSAYVATLSLFK